MIIFINILFTNRNFFGFEYKNYMSSLIGAYLKFASNIDIMKTRMKYILPRQSLTKLAFRVKSSDSSIGFPQGSHCKCIVCVHKEWRIQPRSG